MNSSDDDVTMRILVVYEDSYRSYGQTMVGAIRGLRPQLEAALVQVRELEAEVERLDPHLVICNRPNSIDPGGRAAWVRLSDEPEEPSEFCLAGRRWGSKNPDLEEVLAIIDEMEGLLREGRDLRGC
jgi:hypothetical protein